ncbi:response regulator [candidate division TA06 bacterium]|uniref:Response regulator n=1 Tax=candidate division TA06 bacterium TaxID=2250710 RepID=A0A523XFT1_UNCT6|nr:MAG: response regulator [candidate division TA06 bacterium]
MQSEPGSATYFGIFAHCYLSFNPSHCATPGQCVERKAMARVLIVEQDVLFGERLRDLTSAQGIEPDLCQGLGEAILKLREHHYHALVVDIDQESLDPADVIGVLKAVSPGVSVIAITDENRLEMEKHVREQGIFYYLVKPVEEREYAEAVNRALQYSDSFAV